LSNKRADQMMEAIIDHYRLIEDNPMISSDYTNVSETTDKEGSPISFDQRFFNMKHLDALRESSKFFPRNKSGGYWFYWRINTEGKLVVQNISATADHTLKIIKHIDEIDGNKTIEGMVNRVYFWNEKGPVDPRYLKLTGDDATSQGNYDTIAEYITDSKVTNSTAAGLLVNSRLYDKKDPKVKIRVKLNSEYDLSSIEPGDTVKILNLKNNPFKIGSDDVLIVHSINYSVDSAILELSEAADNFEEIVETERQRLDKEMRWFGYITQQLTAAQLGPANRSWSTDIVFSATSGADAYRQVDWTAGTVYLQSGSSDSAGERVIGSSDTTTELESFMAESTDYFIYLNEETFNTSAANSDSDTSGVVYEGGDALTDAGKSWSNDQYKGYIVTIGGQTKIIRSNTDTSLIIEDRWTIVDTTGAYTIKKMMFDVSLDRSAISNLTNIIFSNVRRNANTESEVIIAPTQGAVGTDNYTFDGESNIAKKSITVASIDTGAINIGVWEGDSSDITQVSNNKFVTDDEEIGAGRAFSGLDVSSRLALGFYDTGLDATLALPTNGIRIDSRGIYGRKSGVTKFYIDSAGDAYFSGTIEATTITGGTLRTSSSGGRVEVLGASDDIRIYDASYLRALLDGSGINLYNTSGNKSASITADAGGFLTIDVSSYPGSGGKIGVTGIISATGYISADTDIVSGAGGEGNVIIEGNGFLNLKAMTGAIATGLSSQNGSMYYLTDTHTVRVKLNGVWQTIGGSFSCSDLSGCNLDDLSPGLYVQSSAPGTVTNRLWVDIS